MNLISRAARPMVFSTLLTLALVCPAKADVKLAPVFTPHMIVQRDRPVDVWGTADAGETVSVTLGAAHSSATADAQGRWTVKLPALAAADHATPLTLTVAGHNRITLPDVRVGDVWLLAGGDMASELVRTAPDAQAIAKDRADADVRLFVAASARSPQPAAWAAVSAKDCQNAPALACVFARAVAQQTHRPVGVIVVSSGGHPLPIEAWVRSATLQNVPAAAPIFAYYKHEPPTQMPRESRTDFARRLARWKQEMQTLPLEPEAAPTLRGAVDRRGMAPGDAFNRLLASLVPATVRGVIWAHGNDDPSVAHAEQYSHLLPVLMRDWRDAWGSAELPFVVVQIPANPYPRHDDRTGAELREAQAAAALGDAHTQLVVTVDLGVKPAMAPIGERAAAAAVSLTGLSTAPSQGPIFDSARTEGDRLVVRFRNAAGLRAEGGKLRGFAVSTPKGRWVWADATIDGDTVVLTAPGVHAPIAAAYAWQSNPVHGANLYNAAGFPAVPFATTQPDYHQTVGVNRPGEERRNLLLRERFIEDPRLPRVLMIGDSIAGGELEPLRDMLAGKANIILQNDLAGVGAFYTSTGALNKDTLKKFLASRDPFDVIQFNMGVHEFAATKNPERDAVAYAGRIRKVTEILKSTGAKVIWCNSTGTLRDGIIPRFPYYLSGAKAFNAAASQVMKEEGVPESDLFGFTQPHIAEWQGDGHIHFEPKAKVLMAKFLLPNIVRALPATPRSLTESR